MSTHVPQNPKIYHIIHMNKLNSIISEGFLWSDAIVEKKQLAGTTIGMATIKARRLTKTLNCYPDLHVGDCVPFYFCPRSVMLYLFYMNNHPDVTYRGGQTSIIHLQSDVEQTINWANKNNKRWVFTGSNAGSFYFNDYADLSQLNQVNWAAVQATDWRGCQEEKQAEFLLENQFPWELVESIGVYTSTQHQEVSAILNTSVHQPPVSVKQDWYY